MNDPRLYIGIDVAKNHLDIVPFDHKPTRIANTTPAIKALLKRIQATGKTVLLCCEATGGYEQKLLDIATENGIDIARVNPERVRYFAKSDGHFAKTDRLDAALLTRFAQDKQPRPYKQPPPHIQRLEDLLHRRAQLIDFQTQDTNRLGQTSGVELRRLIQSSLAHFKRQIALLDKQLRDLVKTTPELRARYDRLAPVAGLGPVTILSLLGHLPELGSYTDQQLTSLAGLAPWAHDSGESAGKRQIRGGRAHVRTSLYMAALVASRHTPILAAFYERLLSRGKPPKLALTALMRKLLCLANRLLSDPSFALTPSPVKTKRA
jgi:transposase